MYPYVCLSSGIAHPIDADINLFGSLLQHLLNTQKVIEPGNNFLRPFDLEIILQPGGKILDTVTKLHFSIPASLNALSNDCNSSLCDPTPFVKNISLGVKICIDFYLASFLKKIWSKAHLRALLQ